MRTTRANGAGRTRRLVTLTAYEDRCWVFAFCFHINNGKAELTADRLTWRDMRLEFPRLKMYDGCRP